MYWFCHTSTCIRHGCTHVPNLEPPCHLPPPTIPLGHPSAPGPKHPVSCILFHLLGSMLVKSIQIIRFSSRLCVFIAWHYFLNIQLTPFNVCRMPSIRHKHTWTWNSKKEFGTWESVTYEQSLKVRGMEKSFGIVHKVSREERLIARKSQQ